MFQYAHGVKINGGSFTVINEQSGMTGALYGFVVNQIATSLQSLMQRPPDIASMGLGRRRP